MPCLEPPIEGQRWLQYLNQVQPNVPLHWSCEGPVVYSGCIRQGVTRVPWRDLDIGQGDTREDEPPPVELLDIPEWLHCDMCGQRFVEDGHGIEHIDWHQTLESLFEELNRTRVLDRASTTGYWRSSRTLRRSIVLDRMLRPFQR